MDARSVTKVARSKVREKWIDRLLVIGLLGAALLIFTINLGGLPLRDWDEGTVAQVAREIWRSPQGSLHWLFPTLGGEPYHNKPPLMHLLIAYFYGLFGVSEWTTRLPGAMLTAISVPLLYTIAREIFPQRRAAICSALVYLTMLPLVRHGRLAMLDGAVVCFLLVMMLCVLRSRRDLRYCLGIGIGFGLICLTKGILGLLLGAIAFVFLLWDTPRLLTCRYLWLGVFLGSIPVALWYLFQYLHYGQAFTSVGMVDQSFSRVWKPVEGNAGPPWYYLVEMLKYTWPWLVFLPHSLGYTWENRNLSWAKLILVWSSLYLLVISLMGTKLPWYVLPMYPILALAIGVQLGAVWDLPPKSPYPRLWVALLALLGLVATAGCIYFGWWSPITERDIQIIFAAVAGTMTLAAILVAQKDEQFLHILFWGSYLSLLLFMNTNNWVWELNEAYPVKPVAAMINSSTPVGTKVYTNYEVNRPSLNFYSDRTVIPASSTELTTQWQQQPHPYFLLDAAALNQLQLPSLQQINQAAGWTLVTKKL